MNALRWLVPRFAAILLAAPMAAQTSSRPAIRLFVTDATLGLAPLDTGALVSAFRAGLLADSFVHLLPPLPGVRDAAARIAPSDFIVSLSLVGARSRPEIRVHGIAVNRRSGFTLDSVPAVGEGLADSLRAAGRRAAKALSVRFQQQPPNEH